MGFPALVFTSSLLMGSLYEIPRSLWKHLISVVYILLSMSAVMVHVSHAYKNMDMTRDVVVVGRLTSQQHASVSQGWICSDKFTCCHTELEAADPTFHMTRAQYTDTGPTGRSVDPITPGAWQGSHWSANFQVTGMTRPRENPAASGIQTWDHPLSRRTL